LRQFQGLRRLKSHCQGIYTRLKGDGGIEPADITHPKPQIQAKYTDCLLLNKYDLVSERELDSVLDHLYELNDETPMIRVSKSTPLKPELVFGLDTKLFERGSDETADWDMLGADGKKESHMDEIETRSVWKGGVQPGKGKKRLAAGDGHAHEHDKGQKCDCDGTMDASERAGEGEEVPVDLEVLEAGLKKLPFEVYRGKLFAKKVKTFVMLKDRLIDSQRVPAAAGSGRFSNTRLRAELGFRSVRVDPPKEPRYAGGFERSQLAVDHDGCQRRDYDTGEKTRRDPGSTMRMIA
jgi:G3E family GTPase